MFAKVFSQILDSSIAEDYLVRLVFEDFLKLADKDGIVDMTPGAIARRTHVPLEIVTRGIEKLSGPDPESRSPDEDGRRIILIDAHRSWGWRIVNYVHYRNIRDEDARRAYFRDRKREQRAVSKTVQDSQGQSKNVLDGPAVSTKAEVDVDVEARKNSCAAASPAPAPALCDGAPLTLPVIDGKDWTVAASDCLAWAQAYPAVNVLTELCKAREWLKANPRNRKTTRGMAKFIVGWLGRAQNSARPEKPATKNAAWEEFLAAGGAQD